MRRARPAVIAQVVVSSTTPPDEPASFVGSSAGVVLDCKVCEKRRDISVAGPEKAQSGQGRLCRPIAGSDGPLRVLGLSPA